MNEWAHRWRSNIGTLVIYVNGQVNSYSCLCFNVVDDPTTCKCVTMYKVYMLLAIHIDYEGLMHDWVFQYR